MPSPEDSSPSPPPQPPISLTPGHRAAAFTDLFHKALSNTLQSIPYDSFASCFPSIAENAPAALRSMHSGLVGRLEEFAKDEFEMILRERGVVERLNGLEVVIAEARRRKARAMDGEDGDKSAEDIPVPPHTLPAPLLLSLHLTPLHISQQSQLNAKLQTTQSQNASLASEIQAQREEMEALLKQVEGLVRDLEGSGGLMAEKIGREDLSGQARDAEVVMSGM